MLLASLFLLNACEGMSAVTKVAMQQLPKKEIRISDLFPSDSMAQKLAVAASEGDLKKVDELIAHGANPNAVGKHGITVIGWLLYHPNKAGLKRLFEHGADPNAIWDKWDEQRRWEWSFIHLATELSSKIGIDYLQMALDVGGNPNLIVRNLYSRPISRAVDIKYFKSFCALYYAGAELDFDDYIFSIELLEYSKVSRNYELTFFLLEHGADYMNGDPFDWAKEFARENCISGPISNIWGYFLYDILHREKSIENMWFWRCIDFLEKKGMDFAVPADVEKLRPKILDAKPTAYELEIEKLKLKEENIDAS
jgi:ankyrin repeat protein